MMLALPDLRKIPRPSRSGSDNAGFVKKRYTPKFISTILSTLFAVFLVQFVFIRPAPLEAVTVPEGIRGFTVTYGTWIESVLAKSPLRDFLYGEDFEQFDKYQRLLITSERMAEEQNFVESLSYLRRASYLLEDIYREMKNRYGWQKGNYEPEETLAWSKEAQNAWAMYNLNRLHLVLHEEYQDLLAGNMDANYRNYCETGTRYYQSISQESGIFSNISKTYLNAYLKELCNDWQKATLAGGSYDIGVMVQQFSRANIITDPGDDYWRQKRIKRQVILLATHGYPQKSFELAAPLLEEDPNIFPFSFRHNLLLLDGKYRQAQTTLEENLKKLDLKEKNNWGQYIAQQTMLIDLHILLQNHDHAVTQMETAINQLESFMKTTYLSADVHDFIDNRILEFRLKRLLLLNVKNPDAELHADLQDIVFPSQTETSLLKLYRQMVIIKGHPELLYKGVNKTSPAKDNWETEQWAQDYRDFYRSLQPKQPGQTADLQKAAKILEAYPADQKGEQKLPLWAPLAHLDLYLAKVARDPALYRETTFLSLWNAAAVNSIQTGSLGFSLTYGYSPDFSLAKRAAGLLQSNPPQMSLETKLAVLRTLTSVEQWHKKMISPPAYFEAAEQQIRYIYLQSFRVKLPGPLPQAGTTAPFTLSQKQNRCAGHFACWLIYPLHERYYSLFWQNGEILFEDFSEPLVPYRDVANFYSSYAAVPGTRNPQAKTEEGFIRLLGLKFRMPLEWLNENPPSDENATVALYLYQQAHSLPIEALYLNKENRLASVYPIVRKIEPDLLNEKFSCQVVRCTAQPQLMPPSNSPTLTHFFLGMAARGGGKLLPIISDGEEIVEIEHLFSEKELLSLSSNVSQKIREAIQSAKDIIFHIAGGWTPDREDGTTRLSLENETPGPSMSALQRLADLPYVVFSKNQVMSFNEEEFPAWSSVLASYHHNHARYLITSTAIAPKEFRQAFFYDFYYKVEHKQMEWTQAFYSARKRTQNVFSSDLWPYLIVIYEME